jgi:hypothetical protein
MSTENDPQASLSVVDALYLPLLFHSPSPWDECKITEWQRITGTREATTRVLCDHIRKVLMEMGL